IVDRTSSVLIVLLVVVFCVMFSIDDRGPSPRPSDAPSLKFLDIVLVPFRWCQRLASALAAIFPAIVTYGVRKLSWSVVLKIAMGLDGYRLKIPMIEQFPRYIGIDRVKYEDMPIGAERRALKNRSAWIERLIGDVSQLGSKTTIAAADISGLLSKIEV